MAHWRSCTTIKIHNVSNAVILWNATSQRRCLSPFACGICTRLADHISTAGQSANMQLSRANCTKQEGLPPRHVVLRERLEYSTMDLIIKNASTLCLWRPLELGARMLTESISKDMLPHNNVISFQVGTNLAQNISSFCSKIANSGSLDMLQKLHPALLSPANLCSP
jgi:hypothetical protein